MDIKSIKEIINSELSNEQKEKCIISILADDKNVITHILDILRHEREKAKELLLDTNAELSRAYIVLKDKNLKYNKNVICDPSFVVEEIKNHYEKWKNYIKCNFKV